ETVGRRPDVRAGWRGFTPSGRTPSLTVGPAMPYAFFPDSALSDTSASASRGRSDRGGVFHAEAEVLDLERPETPRVGIRLGGDVNPWGSAAARRRQGQKDVRRQDAVGERLDGQPRPLRATPGWPGTEPTREQTVHGFLLWSAGQ